MKQLLCGLAMLAAAATFAADDKGKNVELDKKSIQGTWEVVTAEEGGKATEGFRDVRFVFTADMMIIRKKDAGKGDELGVKYDLDPNKKPKAIDTSHELDPGKPIIQLGIYALDGDKLKLCLEAAGVPRPTKFETKAGGTSNLFQLKWVKAEGK